MAAQYKNKTYIKILSLFYIRRTMDGIDQNTTATTTQPLALANVPFNPTTQQPPTTTTNVDNQEGKKDMKMKQKIHHL